MTKTRDEPSIAATTVYTAVSAEPDEREYELTATPVDMSGLYVDRPVRTMDERYSDLVAGRRKLTWTDTFFDDDEDVIAVFDFDYEAMESFYTSVGWVAFGSTLLYTPFFMLSLFAMVPCYLRQNIRWGARSQHVAITRDGIRFVRDKRRCCWGMPCTDQGKSSKTGEYRENEIDVICITKEFYLICFICHILHIFLATTQFLLTRSQTVMWKNQQEIRACASQMC